MSSLQEGSLEITQTVPFNKKVMAAHLSNRFEFRNISCKTD